MIAIVSVDLVSCKSLAPCKGYYSDKNHGMILNEDDTMQENENGEPNGDCTPSFGVMASYYIVHSRLAKCLWGVMAVFWVGFFLSFKVAYFGIFYDYLIVVYLRIFLFPGVILMILTARCIRAWFDIQEWGEADEDIKPSSSPKVSPVFPAELDPLDPRSGPLYLREMGVLKP